MEGKGWCPEFWISSALSCHLIDGQLIVRRSIVRSRLTLNAMFVNIPRVRRGVRLRAAFEATAVRAQAKVCLSIANYSARVDD